MSVNHTANANHLHYTSTTNNHQQHHHNQNHQHQHHQNSVHPNHPQHNHHHHHHQHLNNQQKHQLYLQSQRQQFNQQQQLSSRNNIQSTLFNNNNNHSIMNSSGTNTNHNIRTEKHYQDHHHNQHNQNQTTSNHLLHQHHLQQPSVHYKFHNDCQSSVLTFEQVKRLDSVMDQIVPIHGRGNFPTLFVRLKELIRLVKHKLQVEHNIEIRDVRLNGGAASYILAPENSHYNDLDLIFATELSKEEQFDVIRDVVLECLKEFFPKQQQPQPQQQQQTAAVALQQYQQDQQQQQPQTTQKPTDIKILVNISDQTTQTKQTSQQSTCDVEDKTSSGASIQETIALEMKTKNRSYGSSSFVQDNDKGKNTKQCAVSSSQLNQNKKTVEGNQEESAQINKSDEKTKQDNEGVDDDHDKNCSSLLKNDTKTGGQSLSSIEQSTTTYCGSEDSSIDGKQINSKPSTKIQKTQKNDPLLKAQDNQAVNNDDNNSAVEAREQQYQTETTTKSYKQQQQPMQDSSSSSFHAHFYHNQHQYHHAHQQLFQMPPTNCAIKEAYVHKMVKVNDDDRWSLISLGVQRSELNCCSCCQYSPCTGQLVSASSNSYAQVTANGQQQHQAVSYQQQHHHQSYISYPVTLSSGYERKSQEDNRAKYNGAVQYNQNRADVDYATAYPPHRNINSDKFSYIEQKQQSSHNPHHQSPISIELKFVDRMRRKFEFSVDSFQIILDSLIQFYDCVPSSTISSPLKPSLPIVSTTSYLPRESRSASSRCGTGKQPHSSSSLSTSLKSAVEAEAVIVPNEYSKTTSRCNYVSDQGKVRSKSDDSKCSRGYYYHSHHHNQYRNAVSPSSSSIASSSGCSSSSSFSCDEDHSDLYGDAESASSAASTSSLLSSEAITISSLSSSSPSSTTNARFCDSKTATEVTTASGITTKIVNNNNESETEQQQQNNRDDNTSSNRILDDRYNNDWNNVSNGFINNNNDNYQQLISNDSKNNGRRISCAVISENFYPTVIARSEYGNFKEALYHLKKKLIATRNPEEIRGGGLLKYCNLLVKEYKPVDSYEIRTLERYMCSRFFIDFSDLNQQQAKLESYLANHFSDDALLKFNYLNILHEVVQRSTVCLMNHELRLTLTMIRGLAFKVKDSQ